MSPPGPDGLARRHPGKRASERRRTCACAGQLASVLGVSWARGGGQARSSRGLAAAGMAARVSGDALGAARPVRREAA